jgi:hypothetical protein
MAEQSRYPKTRLVIVSVLVVVLAIVAVIFAFNYWYYPVSTPIPESRVLLNGTIAVSPYDYYIQFDVPSNALSIHVTGNFSVAKGDTIRIYIMNETCYNHFWDTVPSYVPNYDSGRVASGDIDVRLPSGDMYYLLYYKSFEESEKIVTTYVELEYWHY